MKKLLLLIILIPWIAAAQTATPTPTNTPTSTPTPIFTAFPIESYATVGSASSYIVSGYSLQNVDTVILTNDSDEVIYLDVTGGPAVMNSTLRINASGGVYVWSRAKGDIMPFRGIHAICASGSKNLLVYVR